jgi:hypothetical protein
VKPEEVHESVRISLCFGVHLVKEFAVPFAFYNFLVFTLLIMADSDNNIVDLQFSIGHFSVVLERNSQL